jgi:hypothetical protein
MKKNIDVNLRPLLIFAIAFIVLLGLSMLPDGFQIFSYKMKKMDLFQDVRKDTAAQQQSMLRTSQEQVAMAGVIDFGSLITALQNSYNNVSEVLYSEPAAQMSRQQIENPGALKKFFDALKQTGSKKIRIAHYGDSAIEGDNISADLRKNLQAKYGGNGVGLVGVTSQDIQFRITTKLSFSSDWKTSSLVTSNNEKLPLGINGCVYQAANGSWVRYEASGQYAAKNFSNVHIYYTTDKNTTIKYSFDDRGEATSELKAGRNVSECVLNASGKAKSVKITVISPSKTYLYGVSLEESNGIYVDNIPLRGNSGISLRDMDIRTLKDFNRVGNYRLIILNFGLNMISADARDFGWYETAMAGIISKYKEAFPDASILIMSVQDKSKKNGSRFVTDPSVTKLVEAQRRIAQKNGVAFWNLFQAMGGNDSMNDWVEKGLAEKDYSHMKLTGAKKIADLLTDALLEAAR